MKSKNIIEHEIKRTVKLASKLHGGIYHLYLRGVLDALYWTIDKKVIRKMDNKSIAVAIATIDRWADSTCEKESNGN